MELPTNITSTNLANGDSAIAYLREQEAIRRARSKRRWITAGAILAGMFVLMVGCEIAVGAAASSTTAPAPTATTEVPAAPSVSVSAPAPERPSTASTAPAAPAPSTELPRTWITNGDWHVGDEIEAGTYRSEGPQTGVPVVLGSVTVYDAAGQLTDYKSSTEGPIRVTVTAGQTVSVSGALPFTKVG